MIAVRVWNFVFLTVLIASCSVIASSYAAVPPLGDANCKEGSCDSANCASVECGFGKMMDDPSSPCGCCKLCIFYIGENEACGVNMNNRECGPGLTCAIQKQGSEYKCVKLETACFKAQIDYDDRKSNGSLGMYETRPRCDDNGYFIGRKCQPGSSCYCVDVENNRIFGESPPSYATSDVAMNCECSRAYQSAAQKDSLRTVQFPHCLPNGNYDLLQCVNQACFCIDSANQTLTSSIQPITAIMELPCYEANLHTPNYYRPCELERIKAKMLSNSYNRQNITLIGMTQPDCSPDGFYQPLIQTKSTFYCADPYGKLIEHFEIEKESAIANSTNCKCARTRYWLTNQNVVKPFCCANGNYRPIQCRGGVCFCVDPDGNQIDIEVQTDKLAELKCYQQDQYPNC